MDGNSPLGLANEIREYNMINKKMNLNIIRFLKSKGGQ